MKGTEGGGSRRDRNEAVWGGGKFAFEEKATGFRTAKTPCGFRVGLAWDSPLGRKGGSKAMIR